MSLLTSGARSTGRRLWCDGQRPSRKPVELVQQGVFGGRLRQESVQQGALYWRRGRWFAAADTCDLVYQSQESRSTLVVLVGFLIALHLAGVGVAALGAEGAPVRP
jgi:hypothetical protein